MEKEENALSWSLRAGLCGKGLTLYQTINFQTGPKIKLFADDKLNWAEKLKFVYRRVENIVGRDENAGYQHFLLFP